MHGAAQAHFSVGRAQSGLLHLLAAQTHPNIQCKLS